MAEQTPNTTPQPSEEAFIPPYYMLLIAAAGLIVALLVFLTQPTFTVVGWGGLALAVLSLIAWVLIAPQQARAAITGRTARFGGTSIFITLIFIVALILLYIFIRGRDLQIDLTERDIFSLTPESETAINGIGVDPNILPVRIIAFYDAAQAGSRDQASLLFEDYQRVSAGKITYEFVNPDQNPALAQQYGITSPGAIVVVGQNDTGELDVENAELVNFISQDDLTNAILRVAASGDFRAYFLSVTDGLQLDDTNSTGMSTLNNALINQLDWTTQQVTFLQLAGDEPDVRLNDPSVDADVLIIPGGSTALTDNELQIITNYVDAGGSLIILAAPNLDPEQPNLASTAALNDYLYETFGVRFANNFILDFTQFIQSPQFPQAVDFSRNNVITRDFPNGVSVLFNLPRSIEVAPTLPQDVVVDELVRSSAEAYAKTDVQALQEGQVEATETDPRGPFVLGAAAENAVTGARVILFSSESLAMNDFMLGNQIVNFATMTNSLVWATDFLDYFTQVNIQSAQRPEDTPIIVDQQTGSTINFITIVLLPFGILAIGLVVWWNNRETGLKRG
jgi:hypothetical protein